MNVPKLRFKEFNDEWKDKKLKDIVIFSKGNILSKNDLDDNGKFPCILYGQLYTKYKEVIREIFSKTNNDSSNIVKSKIGDVLIPSSGETPIDISTSSCLMLDNILIGGDINILSPKENCNGRFLSYMINNNKKVEIAKVAQGYSIVHLYNDNLRDIIIKMPSLKEQNQVANVLELLDKKIELQSKKIEALKLYKMCISKKLFDNKNLTTTLLKNICNIKKGQQLNNEYQKVNGIYYMLNGGMLPSGYTDNYNTLENTISISEGGNSCGYVNFNREKFWSGGHCYTVEPININNEYLFQLLKYYEKVIMSLRVGSGLPNIQKKDLELFKVAIHTQDEQEDISIILCKIDLKIDLESKKLSNLESLKKGLMQNMFI